MTESLLQQVEEEWVEEIQMQMEVLEVVIPAQQVRVLMVLEVVVVHKVVVVVVALHGLVVGIMEEMVL